MGGWIHKLTEPIPALKAAEPRKVADVSGLAEKMFKDKLAVDKRNSLAKAIGVSPEVLASMHVGIGWDYDGKEFASFPCRDETGAVLGITRRYADGEKKTMVGTSNSGVFVTERWWKNPGAIFIAEGASDVAALATHGFSAIGRPSNTGGGRIIAKMIERRAKDRSVLVVAENDQKLNRRGVVKGCRKSCNGCSFCWPGMYGAKLVAAQIGCRWKALPIIVKDAREWSLVDDDFDRSFLAWAAKEEP